MDNIRDCIDYNIWRGVEDSFLAKLRDNVEDNASDDIWRKAWDNVRRNVGTNTSYSVWGDITNKNQP